MIWKTTSPAWLRDKLLCGDYLPSYSSFHVALWECHLSLPRHLTLHSPSTCSCAVKPPQPSVIIEEELNVPQPVILYLVYCIKSHHTAAHMLLNNKHTCCASTPCSTKLLFRPYVWKGAACRAATNTGYISSKRLSIQQQWSRASTILISRSLSFWAVVCGNISFKWQS